MKYSFIDAEKASFPVTRLCENLGVSTSGFYKWRSQGQSSRKKSDSLLAQRILEIYSTSRSTYGSPRIKAELREAHGIRVGKKRVERLMRENAIQGRRKRAFRRTTESNHGLPVSPNVLQRDFSSREVNRVWVTDVKAIRCQEGWLFLAAILDLYSRRVVGWSMSPSNDTNLALSALLMATQGRQIDKGLIHHSDRGSPYASYSYREALKEHGMVQSMSRRGDCWDNSVAESFFSTLEWEHLGRRPVQSTRETRAQVKDFLRFYNHERRHSTMGDVCPVEYELRCTAPGGAA